MDKRKIRYIDHLLFEIQNATEQDDELHYAILDIRNVLFQVFEENDDDAFLEEYEELKQAYTVQVNEKIALHDKYQEMHAVLTTLLPFLAVPMPPFFFREDYEAWKEEREKYAAQVKNALGGVKK